MVGHPVYYAIAVFFLIYHPSVRADSCPSVAGILVNKCQERRTGSSPNPSVSPLSINACTDYKYNGAAKKTYQYKGSAPFTITIKSASITGSGISVGRFMCKLPGEPEDCHTYEIQNTANPEFSFKKDDNRLFSIHGKGSLTFMIDNGNCNSVISCNDATLGSKCDTSACCAVLNSECDNSVCKCAAGYTELHGRCAPPCGDGALGSDCDTSSCCTAPNSACVNFECKCAADYKEVYGSCVTACGNGTLGAYCDTLACCTIPNSVCDTSECKCDPDYRELFGGCVARGRPCVEEARVPPGASVKFTSDENSDCQKGGKTIWFTAKPGNQLTLDCTTLIARNCVYLTHTFRMPLCVTTFPTRIYARVSQVVWEDPPGADNTYDCLITSN